MFLQPIKLMAQQFIMPFNVVTNFHFTREILPFEPTIDFARGSFVA
jgi:hypothetical protein